MIEPPAQTPPPPDLRPLHPGIRTVWQLSGIANACALTAALGFAETASRLAGAYFPVPFVSVGLFVPLLLLALWYASARYRAWRLALTASALVVEFGVVWRVRRSVPRARVQHVDIHSGPLDRLLGLAQVSLYAAGSTGPVVTVPGLTPNDAQALRDALVTGASR